MSSRKTTPPVEEHQVEGHSVRIRKEGDKEELWIDGTRRRFSVTKDGYTLHEDAYAPPQKSLLEAAKAYLKRAHKREQSS